MVGQIEICKENNQGTCAKPTHDEKIKTQKEAKSGDPVGMWGDTDSAVGLEVDQASATVWSLDLNTGVNIEAKSKSGQPSRASSESEWEVLPKKRNRSKAGSAASCSSKASRVSSLMESVSGLRKRQSPP